MNAIITVGVSNNITIPESLMKTHCLIDSAKIQSSTPDTSNPYPDNIIILDTHLDVPSFERVFLWLSELQYKIQVYIFNVDTKTALINNANATTPVEEDVVIKQLRELEAMNAYLHHRMDSINVSYHT